MFETDDFAGIPAISEATKPMREPLRESSPEFVTEFENQPRSASELARHFGVTDRAVQNWYPIIKSAYLWMPETDLRVGTGKNTRYLPPAVKAMTELRDARSNGQTADQWVASVHRENGEAIAAFKASQLPAIKPEVTVESNSALTLLNPEVLALYNQSQQPQDSLPAKTETKLYFTPTDYSNRYQSTEIMVANQTGKEVNFANELLAKFAEMAADNQAWNQAENQKQDVQQRDATLRGMNRALSEFLNENTAYRGLKHQLETGQISPEQVLTMLAQFQGKEPAPSDSNAV